MCRGVSFLVFRCGKLKSPPLAHALLIIHSFAWTARLGHTEVPSPCRKACALLARYGLAPIVVNTGYFSGSRIPAYQSGSRTERQRGALGVSSL